MRCIAAVESSLLASPIPGVAASLKILIVTDAWAPQVNGVVRTYENLQRELEAAASAREITLSTQPAAEPLFAKLDHGRILQVLGNLITNSVKFTPPGGRILIGGERIQADVRFCVSDTGLGIPADKLEVIFERFRQLDKSDRQGVGLGLYIARCVVQAHGGRIWAESKLGEGTRVYFTMPCAA